MKDLEGKLSAATVALSSSDDRYVRHQEEAEKNKEILLIELDGLKTQLSENSKGDDTRIAELSDLKETFSKLKSSKENVDRLVEEQAVAWKSKEEELISNAAEHEKIISQFTTEVSDAEVQITDLKARLQELEVIKSSVEMSGAEQSDQMNVQRVEIESMRSCLSALEKTLLSKESEVTALTTTLSGAEDAVDEHRVALKTHDNASAALLLETTTKFKEEIEHLQAEEKHLQDKVSSAVKGLAVAQKSAAEFKELYDKAKPALAEAEKKVAESETVKKKIVQNNEKFKSKIEELTAQVAVMVSEKEEQEKFKERTKASVSTMLEKLKHFKTAADQKTEEVTTLTAAMECGRQDMSTAQSKLEALNDEVTALQAQLKDSEKALLEAQEKADRLESETAGTMRTAQEDDAKSVAERQRLDEEKQQESSLSASDLEGLRGELAQAQRLMEEREGRIKVFEETLSSYTGLIAEKGEEIDELKRYLHDLKAQVESAEAKTIRAESETSIAVVDLTALSERYVQAQEARTLVDRTAAEHAAAAERALDDLKEATSAIEDRDAQLSSYGDHVEMLERTLKKEQSAVTHLQSDYDSASADVQKVSYDYELTQHFYMFIFNAYANTAMRILSLCVTMTSHHTIPHPTTQHYITPHYTALHHTKSLHTTPHYTTPLRSSYLLTLPFHPDYPY